MELPLDVLMSHILIRLPVKSLVRCMCVTKQWHAFLKSQTFAKMHLRQIAHDDHQNKLLAKSMGAPCTIFRVIDCEALDDHLAIFPLKVSNTNIWFLSSCNGLVLVGLQKKGLKSDKFYDLILWNPLTGEYKIFSQTNSPEKVYHKTEEVFELYYTSWDDDYRILHITEHHDVYIYSLKSDSWRNVDSPKIPDRTSYNYWKPCTCLNENLYFLKDTYNGERPGTYSYSVTRFDTQSEIFTAIPTHPNFKNWCSSLTVERGCMYLCHKANLYVTELWKMSEEDGGWMKVATYLPNELLYSHGCLKQQLYLLRDGYWLMMSASGHIYKVDLENRHEIKSCEYISDDFHQVDRYIETFVSPNQYAN